MKEQSLVDRIRAIIGVLIGSVAWVVRLLFSMVGGVLKDITGKGDKGQQRPETRSEGAASQRDTRADSDDEEDDLSYTHTEAAPGLSSDQHRGMGGVPPAPRMGDVAAANLSSMGSVYDEQSTQPLDESDQTEDGQTTRLSQGIPNLDEPGGDPQADVDVPPEFRTGNDEEAFAGRGYTYSDTQARYGIDTEDPGHGNELREGIPYIEEPGPIDRDVVGSEQLPVSDTDGPVADYAGQPVSESDIGVDRPDSGTDLAGSMDDDDGGDGDADMYDVVNREDMGPHAATPGGTNGVSAASRGWVEQEDTVLANDPLYGDFEPMETGEEVDLRNDEADAASSSGMHVVDSPDEPFIEDEPLGGDLGLDDASTDLSEIDDVTNLETATIDETMLAADATGRPIGDDPASGDLGARQSFDDTERPAEAGYEPGNVMGAYDGSGVDEFADDRVVQDLLEDVSETGEQDSVSANQSEEENNEEMTTESGDETTQSAAWASASGVVNEALTKPVGVENLGDSDEDGQSQPDGTEGASEPGSGEGVYEDFTTHGSPSDAVRAPQYDPEDAGLRDVAAEIAEDIDVDGPSRQSGTPGDEGVDLNDPRTTTPSEPGQDGSDHDDPRETRSARAQAGVHAATRASSGGPAGSVRGDGTPNCPDGYPIKGNARSKIYHTPADSSYEGTIAEFCFATEDDARAAGFRPRKS